jgi:hypothetical protein
MAEEKDVANLTVIRLKHRRIYELCKNVLTEIGDITCNCITRLNERCGHGGNGVLQAG